MIGGLICGGILLAILGAGIAILAIMTARGTGPSDLKTCPSCGHGHDLSLCRDEGATASCGCCRDILVGTVAKR